MRNTRIFSASKYAFLKKHSTSIIAMILDDIKKENSTNREFILSLIDYLTISKYHDYLKNGESIIYNQQVVFEKSVDIVEDNLYDKVRTVYEEITIILNILKLNSKDLLDSEETNEKVINNILKALEMYEEYNLEKQQKEEDYGQYHK